MAKAGEIKPLMSTIEDGQNLDIRLAVINLLALSGRAEIIPPFRRLPVRGSLPGGGAIRSHGSHLSNNLTATGDGKATVGRGSWQEQEEPIDPIRPIGPITILPAAPVPAPLQSHRLNL